MLTLPEIEKSYPVHLRSQKRFLLREYLQYKILKVIFDSEYSENLAFLGGTCLRIVHGNTRFSEDLDFDNVNIEANTFELIATEIKKELSKEGYQLEIKTVYKGAYHCYIRFPALLFNEGLSGFPEEKILIQLDTEPQHFEFKFDNVILNKFDVFTRINTTPKELLLAQKFYTVLNRTRNKGRDFFDIIFLLGMIDKPNYDYLEMKTGISNSGELKNRILKRCSEIDMDEMARDVQPFLFDQGDTRKVKLFAEFLQQFTLK